MTNPLLPFSIVLKNLAKAVKQEEKKSELEMKKLNDLFLKICPYM